MPTNQMSEVIQHVRRAVLLRDGAGLTDGQLLEDFISRREEAALAALVRRHGPMVWGVCRRVLRNYHDAEDAFQATFLVLVRKAASVVPRGMVVNWLYGVANQAALKAKATAAKRRARERQVIAMPEPEVVEQDRAHDLQALLDQELSRLPDKYRVVILLCDLEGKTRKEAARQLDLPEGTVAGQLARARVMLAKRIARHGAVVSGGALAALLSQGAASASVPAPLVISTVKAASLFAAGQAARTGVVSSTVAALTEGVLKTMLLTKLKIATALLLVVATLAVGLRGLIDETQASPPASTRNEARAKPEDQEREKLQGTWIAISTERKGEQIPEEKVKEAKIRLVISRDRFTLKTARDDEGSKGTVKIDPTQQPKTMDLDWSANRPEDGKGLNAKGIYEVEGDTLKFCFGIERPTEFKTKRDRDLDMRMYVFKREKPAGEGQVQEETKAKPQATGKGANIRKVLEAVDWTLTDVDTAKGTISVDDCSTYVQTGNQKIIVIKTPGGSAASGLALHQLRVDTAVKIALDGKPAKLDDLKAGMRVLLRAEEDRSALTKIEASSPRPPVFRYVLKELDAKAGTITVTLAERELDLESIPVAKDAQIRFVELGDNSRFDDAKLGDLQAGAHLALALSADKDGRIVVSRILATK